MPVLKIRGTWYGEYTYEPKEPSSVVPPPVGFTFTVPGGWIGFFRGTIQDDPNDGWPEPATVSGRVYGGRLTFSKCYPSIVVFHGGRCISLSEFLAHETGLHIDIARPGYPISYEGTYDPDTECVRGTWQIRPRQLRFLSDGKTVSVKASGAQGLWTMRRG